MKDGMQKNKNQPSCWVWVMSQNLKLMGLQLLLHVLMNFVMCYTLPCQKKQGWDLGGELRGARIYKQKCSKANI
eukprot:4977912-Amphidinium_carterae.1